jgi:hypothetical protein
MYRLQSESTWIFLFLQCAESDQALKGNKRFRFHWQPSDSDRCIPHSSPLPHSSSNTDISTTDLSNFTTHIIHQPTHILRYTLPPLTHPNNYNYIIYKPETEPNDSYTPYTPTPGIRVSYSKELSHRLRDRVIYGPPHEYEPMNYPTIGILWKGMI